MVKNGATNELKGWESPAAVHPGLFLQDFLEEFSMSQDELAKRIELTPKSVNEIVRGKANITNATALKLSKVFPVSEEYWNNLQEQYESDLARLEEKARVQEEVKKLLPDFEETYKELTRFCLIEKHRWVDANYEKIVRALQKFYGANSLSFVKEELIVGTAFRAYEKKSINSYSVAAWLRVGEITAQKIKTPVFDARKLKQKLNQIKGLSNAPHAEYLPELERILHECGVVLIYMPYFKNTHVQGAVKWLGKDKVMLMLNASKKSEDKFWFNLFHELGHILKHGKINKLDSKKIYIDLEERQDNEIEKEADEFAQSQLIPDFESAYKQFCSHSDYRRGVLQVSKQLGISPAIFAGRLAHEYEIRGNNVYPQLSQFWSTRINYQNISYAG